MLKHFRPPLILGGFSMDPGLLLPYFKSGIGHHCPVTKETGQNFILQRDLSGKLVRMYDNCTAIVIAEPPPPHVATTPVPPTVLSKLTCVTIESRPPPVFMVSTQPLSQVSTALV